MDELVKLVVDRTGLPEDKARLAVQTVIGYLKDRLPGPAAAQVENVLDGGSGSSAGDIAKGLGGMLRKK